MAAPVPHPHPLALPEDRVEVVRLLVAGGPFTVNPLPPPLQAHLFAQPDGGTLLVLSRPTPHRSLWARLVGAARRRRLPRPERTTG